MYIMQALTVTGREWVTSTVIIDESTYGVIITLEQ